MPTKVLRYERDIILRELEKLASDMIGAEADADLPPHERAIVLIDIATRLKSIDRRYRALLN
jgi:hypothetical protein